MGCDRYEEVLNDLAAGAEATPALQAHLRECAACRERLDAQRHLLSELESGLAEVLRVTPSPGFEARLRAGLAEDERRKSRLVPWALALAAGLVIASLLAWKVIGQRRPSSPEPQVAVSTPAPVAETPSAEPARPDPPAAPLIQRRMAATAQGQPRIGRRPARVKEPEVLVPPGQEEAIAQLLAMLRSRRVEPGSLLADGLAATTPLADITPLVIPPLESAAPLEISERRSDS